VSLVQRGFIDYYPTNQGPVLNPWDSDPIIICVSTGAVDEDGVPQSGELSAALRQASRSRNEQSDSFICHESYSLEKN
jgi:hypothetical protein